MVSQQEHTAPSGLTSERVEAKGTRIPYSSQMPFGLLRATLSARELKTRLAQFNYYWDWETTIMSTRITEARSLEMFARANVKRAAFMRALVRMGPHHLKTAAMRKLWSADNPTLNYCYVIAEWTKYFALRYDRDVDPRVKAFKLAVEGYDTWHNFVRDAEGVIIDLAAEQFADYSLVVYANGKPTTFMQAPSKRARLLEEYYREEVQRSAQ